MAKEFKLRKLPSKEEENTPGDVSMDRRKFMGYGFNAAGGVLAASIGALGFASILMPPSSSDSGGMTVVYWAKGREDEAWYGDKHLMPMNKTDFVDEAAGSTTGMSGAQGVWNGLPVVVMYVPNTENKKKPIVTNSPRFQYMDGYDSTGSYVGNYEDLVDTNPIFELADDLIMIFSRCTHLCCIPGWQLVSNQYTDDNWTPGGGDDGGSKLFCICHSSRFDPTALELNKNVNRGNGQTFTYAGIRRSGGPAPVGLPIIPLSVGGDGTLEGLADYTDWLTFCD